MTCQPALDPAPSRPAIARLWPILLPALALILIFPYLPQVRSPNELCRLRQSQALVEDGALEINGALKRHGWAGDLSCVAVTRDASGRIDSRMRCPEAAKNPQEKSRERIYYPSKAPLLSLMAVPVYAALRMVSRGEVSETLLVFFARLFCTILPAILILIPLRRFLRRRLRDAMAAGADEPAPESDSEKSAFLIADALTAAFALGTLAFSYAELFMSHGLTGCLVLSTFFALEKASRSERACRWMLLSGALAGLTVAAEYTGALALIPLAAYGLAALPGGLKAKVKAGWMGILGVLPFALLIAAYHLHCFGHPFVSPYLFLNDAGYQGWHTGGFLGIRLPDARAFILSFFSPLRGLFTLSPFLLLAPIGLVVGLKTDRIRHVIGKELLLSFALLFLYTYFTSSFTYDSWGWTTGPRHLTPLVGFLLLPIGALLTALFAPTRPSSALKCVIMGISAGFIAMSLITTGLMTLINYIPDAVANSVRELAWPMALSGYLPHSPLSLLGVPNPFAALPGIAAILLTLVLIILSFMRVCKYIIKNPQNKLYYIYIISCILTCTAVFALQMAYSPSNERDSKRSRDTVEFLQKHFDPQPGMATRL